MDIQTNNYTYEITKGYVFFMIICRHQFHVVQVNC